MSKYICYNCRSDLYANHSIDIEDANFKTSKYSHIITEFICTNCELICIEEVDKNNNLLYFGPLDE